MARALEKNVALSMLFLLELGFVGAVYHIDLRVQALGVVSALLSVGEA